MLSAVHVRKYIVLVLLLSSFGLTTMVRGQELPDIIGGSDAAEDAWPWIVAVVKADVEDNYWAQFCAGILIDPHWVLTVAHCTYRSGESAAPSEIAILLNNGSLREVENRRIEVDHIVRHPDYDRPTGDSDIALLRLVEPVNQPLADLVDRFDLTEEGETIATVLGWGRTTETTRSETLKMVEVPIVAQVICREAYHRLHYVVTDNMLCGGYATGGKDACTGDSGGPLVVPVLDEGDQLVLSWSVVGIVSWGKGCAEPHAYGVYTSVAQFRDWIKTEIAGNLAETISTTLPPPVGQELTFYRIYLPYQQ